MAILIRISLGTLIIIALISVLTGGNLQGTLDTDIISSEATVNQTSSIFSFEGLMNAFYIDPFSGALVIIIALIAIIVIIGLNIFGIGLSDTTVKNLTIFIEYLVLWLIFSVLSYALIISIEIIGGFLYLVLTILFVIGVFQKANNG